MRGYFERAPSLSLSTLDIAAHFSQSHMSLIWSYRPIAGCGKECSLGYVIELERLDAEVGDLSMDSRPVSEEELEADLSHPHCGQPRH